MDAWKAHGITFVAMAPLEDAVSLEAALDIVRRRFTGGVDKPGLSARYGVMSARSPAIRRDPQGEFEPLVWERPVWVISVPNQWIPGGRGGRPYRARSRPEPQPMHYVLDGTTGEYLLAFGP